MGYAFGLDSNGREIGYGVEATCDLDGCNAAIDRGMAHRCGGWESECDDDVPGCGGFFCAGHLVYIMGGPSPSPGGGFCPPCAEAIGIALSA